MTIRHNERLNDPTVFNPEWELFWYIQTKGNFTS